MEYKRDCPKASCAASLACGDGNPFVLLLDTSHSLLSVPGVGLIISTVSSTERQAFATNVFVVIRGTFLKGVGLAVLWPQMLTLAALGVALLTMSVLRFRTSLD